MKVLQVSTRDILGGAARAANRLHKGLLDSNFDSKMLVQRKESGLPSVQTPYESKIAKVYSILRPYANFLLQKLQKTTNPIYHSSNILPSGIHKVINKSDADIVHLHWINEEMISIREIGKINKPTVWTFHDMWPFCGAEHYHDLESPGRFKDGYTPKNRPESYGALDIDRWTYNRKLKNWSEKKISVITPSNWLANHASDSKIFSDKNIEVIPNGIDLNLFKPTKKKIARNILDLPQEKKIVGFGAMNATSNPIKGYEKLEKAKQYLMNENFSEELLFLVFGNSHRYLDSCGKVNTQYLGTITDDITLSLVYSAADAMVVPSLIDNLPNTTVESIACGTPVISFEAGGIPDIVDHESNGFLAKPYDPKDLASGITWILKDDRRLEELSKNARKKAKSKFDIEKVTKLHIKKYKEVLS